MTLWMRPHRNDDSNKATWPDLSGHGNHGTLSGFAYTEASGWTPYPALKLAGDNDKVVTAASADLACSGPVTVEVWCTPPAGAGGLMLLGTGTGLTDGYALYLRHAAGADVSWRVNPDGTMRYILGIGTIAYGDASTDHPEAALRAGGRAGRRRRGDADGRDAGLRA